MSKAKTRGKRPSRIELERRRQQSSAGRRVIAHRSANSRYRQRERFCDRGKRMLGNDVETAWITIKAHPELFEILLTELDETPGKLTGGHGVTYPVHVTSRVPALDADGLEVKRSDASPWLDEVIQHGTDRLVKLETLAREDRQAHADHWADIDAAVASGDWSALMLTAAEGLCETRIKTRRRRDPDVPSASELIEAYDKYRTPSDLLGYTEVDYAV